MRDARSAAEQPELREADASSTVLAQADTSATPQGGASPENTPPDAPDLCIVTAEDATLSFSVPAKDPDGDPLTVAATQPQSGSTRVGPEGTLVFVADEPGLQRFDYSVQDGRGGSDSADATVFVNPVDQPLIPPVMSQVAPADLPALARACASGLALDMTTLRGSLIQIQDPSPGQRFQIIAEPGQQIELQSRDFVEATYLVVDGGLLVVTPDGNIAYVADFAQAAQSDDPVTLSVYEGPAIAGDELLQGLLPLADTTPGDTTVGQLAPPGYGPEHGGGAGFSPYDPGNIGTGPDPLGPLAPTALALATPPVLFDTGVAGADNQPPTVTLGQVVPVGEVTVTPEFSSAHAFPQLAEQQALDAAQIRGIDQGNLTLGPSADARITFVDEAAQFQNSLGVYLIGPDGAIRSPKVVFPQIELADADPNQPAVRPGGGPLNPGDSVLLSTLYPGELQEGDQFGLFFIAEGWTLNGDNLNGDLAFLSNGQPATINDPTPQLVSTVGGATVPIEGNIYHSADPTPGDGLANPLNEGGRVQATSGLEASTSGLTVSFEDFILRTSASDDDVNDTIVQVELLPTTELNFGFVPEVAPDLEISDTDSGNLGRATVEIVSGNAADTLLITASLVGTGITALEDGSAGRVVLEGVAPVDTYETVLRSVRLQAAGSLGEREISIQVEDEQGAASAPVVTTFDFTTTSLIAGSDADDPSLQGTAGNDPISGRAGNDELFGGDGVDLLSGGVGDDILHGGPGDDLLFGGPGNDTVFGDDGADQFFILSLSDRGDTIMDFNADQGDVLNLSALFDPQTTGGIDVGANADLFLQFEQSGANDVAVSADLDGPAAGFEFFQVATLVDPVGVSAAPNAEQQAVNSGAVAV